MYFQRLDEAGADDGVDRTTTTCRIVIPQASLDKIRGSTLDLSGARHGAQEPQQPQPGGRRRPPDRPT